MSRKGNLPIPLPKGVEVKVTNNEVTVKGPKGLLTQSIPETVSLDISDSQIVVSIDKSTENASAFHGLYRSLISNMVVGTTQGFEKKLEMIGVGYRAAVKGNSLDVQVGFSHPSPLEIPEGISVTVEKNTNICITGIDKQRVGQFAADIRSLRPPEPYQGKGIRYQGEYVRRKAGKAASR
ncbi:MAG: 50S ribosomal protein L6 [Chlamydiota bacterium]